MLQVLDVISILDALDEGDSSAKIVWRLESASTNSPFTVTAGAESSDPTLSVRLEANRVTDTFSDSLGGLLAADRKAEAVNETAARAFERVFKRNLNGVGRTDVVFPDDFRKPLHIVPSSAQRGLITLERAHLDDAEAEPNLAHTEFGAREGEVVGLGHYHNSPAITLRDWLTREKILAVLTEELAKRLGPVHNWSEAWEGRRLLVSGEIHYDAGGLVRKIDAIDIEEIAPPVVKLHELEGIDILGTRSALEHILDVWSDVG